MSWSSDSSSDDESTVLVPADPANDFTYEAAEALTFEDTIPSSVISDSRHRKKKTASATKKASPTGSATSSTSCDPHHGKMSSKKSPSSRHSSGPSASLMAEMSAAMKLPASASSSRPATDVFKHNMLATIAEDPDLTASIVDTSDASIKSVDTVRRIARSSAINVQLAVKAIAAAQRVCMCFLLDTTGCMQSHILGVRDQITTIIADVSASGCTITGLAFVGYKDWCDGSDHLQVLDFPSDIPSFRSFLGRVTASGGGDTPEDVLGGLMHTTGLAWPSHAGTRIVFHIGDAPPHGTRYYSGGDDSLPSGHPSDKPPEHIFRLMKQLNITYYFGKINSSCDKMIAEFTKCNGAPVDSFDVHDAASIARSVSVSIMKSVSIASAIASSSSKAKLREQVHTIDGKEPDFARIPTVKATIVSFELTDDIATITEFKPFLSKNRNVDVKVAPKPFAKGSVRLAYYGQLIDKKRGPDNVVFKEFIRLATKEALDRSRYMVDLETQTVAAKFAFEFNSRLLRTSQASLYKIKFLLAKVVRIQDPVIKEVRFLAQEKRYRGGEEMVRFTNNHEFVRSSSSHTSSTSSASVTSDMNEQVAVCGILTFYLPPLQQVPPGM